MVYGQELQNATTNEQITAILNRTEQENIKAVGEKLSSLKPMLYGFEVDSGKNDIILGNINAYVAWSGDAAYAIDVASGEVEDEDGNVLSEEKTRSLSYSIPEEGSNIWFDGFVMPSGSTNYDSAYKFLEFISRPENVIRNMDYTGYTSMVATDEIFEEIVIGWFDESEDLEEDEWVTVDYSYLFGGNAGEYQVVVSEEGYGRLIAQYPTEDIVNRCAIMSNFDSDTLMSINDMWESVKSEEFPTWVILVVVVIVAIIGTSVALFRNKDRLNWLNPDPNAKTKMEKKGYRIVKVENLD
jgi:spermidine/putrescine transport system substrate-binding protein